MISYIVYAITSILIWNISVVIMDSLRIAFYVFNPSLIIIPVDLCQESRHKKG